MRSIRSLVEHVWLAGSLGGKSVLTKAILALEIYSKLVRCLARPRIIVAINIFGPPKPVPRPPNPFPHRFLAFFKAPGSVLRFNNNNIFLVARETMLPHLAW